MPPEPRARATATMKSDLKPHVLASVPSVRAIRCAFEQGSLCCPRRSSGRHDEQAEAAGCGERQARQGDELRSERREAACAAEPRARAAAEMMSELKPKAAASVEPVRAISCTRAEQREAACAARAEGERSGRDDE